MRYDTGFWLYAIGWSVLITGYLVTLYGQWDVIITWLKGVEKRWVER